MDNRFVYVDNSATTKVSKPVLDAMMPYLTQQYGNPSSIYTLGRNSLQAIEDARAQVAAALGCKPSEITFTGCGTESDNWALKGVCELMAKKGKTHIITTNFEHHAILHTCAHLEKQGFTVTYLPVNQEGFVTKEQVEQAMTDQTALVSIMYANNEIGTIQPIAAIGKLCKERGILFHTDAVQAIGNVEINVVEQNIDLLSLSAHKIHGIKGVGALYCRRGIRLPNLLDGGAQENNRRGGTENTPGIVGLGVAITQATKNIPEKQARLSAMRDRLLTEVPKIIPNSRVNGSMQNRLCTNCNISFEAVEGEALLLMLDLNGIAASSGSACTSGSLDPSHVLLAIGLPHEIAHGSLRISFSEENTMEDVDYILERLPIVVQKLRDMSPLWERDEVKS